MSKESTINGQPASTEQYSRVLFLQEKKRRIQAEAKLLLHEEQMVDAELDEIVSSLKVAPAPKKTEEGAA